MQSVQVSLGIKQLLHVRPGQGSGVGDEVGSEVGDDVGSAVDGVKEMNSKVSTSGRTS